MKVVAISDVPDNVELPDNVTGTLKFLANTSEGPELIVSQEVEIRSVDDLLTCVEVDPNTVKDGSVVIFKFPSDFSYREIY